jgi:poly(3-hydroxybutyrate) depolymerase
MGCELKSYGMIAALGLCSLSVLACGGGQNGQPGDVSGGQATGAAAAPAATSAGTSGASASGAGGVAAVTPTAGSGQPAVTPGMNMPVATAAGAGGAVNSGDVANSAAGATAEAGSGAAGTPATEEACTITVPSSMDCGAKIAPGDHRTCMLGNREYILHAGKTMNLCKPVALVIDAHGASETAPEQFGSDEFCASGNICWHGIGSGWAAEADSPGGGFIAIFPQGNNNMWSAADAEFMLDIVEEMKKLADIDPKRVYMSGISNGGFLTFQTGCAHADVFSGMAPVAGGTTCSTVKKPIPLISFDAEPDFAYDGHVTAMESVVRANNCKGEAKPWLTIDGNYTEPVCRNAKQDPMAMLVPCNTVTSQTVEPTVCKIWEECDDGVKVAWCDVAPNMEHGESNAALDAHILYENDTLLNMPSVAWRFFQMF